MSRAPSRAPTLPESPPPVASRTPSPSEPGDYKRLIVCCDGTWMDSGNGLDERGHLVPPSNVTRITRAIRAVSREGIPQIVYYQAGIASTGTIGNKVIGGVTGAGLAENVREAYMFIANNWVEGDEIFFFGFSRGAFTARACAGLISNIGVMTKAGVASFPVVYKDFAHRNRRHYRSPQPDIPFPNKPPFRDPAYVEEMQRRGLTTLGVKVQAIGVWDTVGSLGVPRIAWLNRFGRPRLGEVNEYSFYDTSLDPGILRAYQALALDEKRASFQPAVWEKRRNDSTELIQCWFPGSHANVGGGYPDQEIANISLAWMMSLFGPLLDLNNRFILTEEKENRDYYASRGKRSRPWSFGEVYNSVVGPYAIAGSTVRTPGMYNRIDRRTGEPTNRPLRNTNEYIHASVRTRFRLHGPGIDDKGDYEAEAMREYRLRSDLDVGGPIDGLPTPYFWEHESRTILPEAPLRAVEKLLLSTSPDVDEYVFEPSKSGGRRQP